jgi:hypothetical protein
LRVVASAPQGFDPRAAFEFAGRVGVAPPSAIG